MSEYLKKEWNETKVLFRCMPTIPFAFLVVSLIAMNFLANRGGAIGPIPFDCGIIVSWVVFLASDMLVKRFGAKASIKINLAALILQLVAVGIMALGALIPFATYGATAEESQVFTAIFVAAPWPLFAGAGAALIGNIVNAVISKFILLKFKDRTSAKAYVTASWVSTSFGQFVDNFMFGIFFSMWQPWFLDCGTFQAVLHLIPMSALGMVIELLCQVVFSPVGFRIAERWRKNNVGQEYVDLVEEAKEVNRNLEISDSNGCVACALS